MKLLHTSDWHLGKRLFRLERLPEQVLFLEELLKIIQQEQIDHLLVAGDIFDVPQPPHRALKLFYDFIAKFCVTTNAQMWVIGGNHDSGTLLDAPQGLIDEKRIHLYGSLRGTPTDHWVKLSDDVSLALLPYFRGHELSAWNKSAELEVVLKDFLQLAPSSGQKILMAHHLFGLYEAAGSEQALALSGLESIPLDWLNNFDYVALGHIHKPQTLKKSKPMVRYSGSPLPMRFSEIAPKGVEILEFSNEFTHRTLPLTTYRPLYSLALTPENWKKTLTELPKGNLPAALEITLKLTSPIPGLVEEIRLWGEQNKLEILGVIPQFGQEEQTKEKDHWTELLSLSPEKLFEAFYQHKFPDEKIVPAELLQDMKELWEEARHAPPTT
jgi:exonuclease SbcD